jgi:hypothetical protein
MRIELLCRHTTSTKSQHSTRAHFHTQSQNFTSHANTAKMMPINAGSYNPGWQSMDSHMRYHQKQQQQLHPEQFPSQPQPANGQPGYNYYGQQQPQPYASGYAPALPQHHQQSLYYQDGLGPNQGKKGKSKYIAKAMKGLGKVFGDSGSSSDGHGHGHGHSDHGGLGGHGDGGGWGGDGGGSSGGDGGGGGAS